MNNPSPLPEHRPRSRLGQAIAGVFVAAVGLFLGRLFWWLAAHEGMFAPVGPFFAAGMVLRRLRRTSKDGLLLLLWLASGALYAVALRLGWILP